MSAGYTFVQNIVEGTGLEKQGFLVTATLIAAAVTGIGYCARAALDKAEDPLRPEKTLSLRNTFEILAAFILWLGDNAMGPENRKYLPFACSLFLFLFCMNICGLIPGVVMPTDQFQFNLGIALTVFALYNYWGVREVGIWNYLKHLWGPVFLIGPFLFCIELLSHVVRPVTLSLRLFGNMTGDHLALSIFTALSEPLKIPVPVIFYVLGTVVCFIQAFVFTLLTMVYIRLAVAHEEHH